MRFFAFGNGSSYDLLVTGTLCRPILSVIILIIAKSDSCSGASDFVNHLYDFRLNWTPLSPIYHY